VAASDPDKVALVHFDGGSEASITYAELDKRANQLASLLIDIGVERDDRVALMAPNGIDPAVARIAIWRSGAAEVPVNTMYRRGELEHILTDSAAGDVIFDPSCSPAIGDLDLMQQADRPRLVSLGGLDPLADVAASEAGRFGGQGTSRPVDPDTLAFVAYTSGTTGVPKGAMVPHRNCSLSMEIVRDTLELGPDDVQLHSMPMFHSNASLFGYLMGWYIRGTSVSVGRFEAPAFAELVARHRITCGVLVPTMLYELNRLGEEQDVDLSSFRYMIFGASPTPPRVREKFEQTYGITLLHCYGMTEAPNAVTMDPLDTPPRPGTVGLPLPHVKVRIVDDDNHEVPVGQPGEVVLSTQEEGPYAGEYQPIPGYFKKPEANLEALARGWFHTGDIGVLDDDGYLSIVDRKKDMIIASGYNIFPAELERVLVSHPAISEAYVVGIPHERRVEAPMAFIVLEEDAELSESETKGFIREQLAPYKALAAVEFVATNDLPRNALGKVLKREIRHRLVART
jgi:acyl-CoA synthetase (AMP-forming)/AMP-acid ligase II